MVQEEIQCSGAWQMHLSDAGSPFRDKEPLPPPGSASDRRMSPRLKLLLVEDNCADAHLVTTLFEANKFRGDILRLSDGQAAIDYLLGRNGFADSPLPDLILLDLNLPIKNGFEVLEEIRKHAPLSKIPVFILTTSRNAEDMALAYSRGVFLFSVKPLDLMDYESLVKKFITVDFPTAMSHTTRRDNTHEPN